MNSEEIAKAVISQLKELGHRAIKASNDHKERINFSLKSLWGDTKFIPKDKLESELYVESRPWSPHFCGLCWRLFVPEHWRQSYHANVCGVFVEQVRLRKGILNAVDFLPANTLREIGGTIWLPRAYIVLALLGLCELRLRWRLMRPRLKTRWRHLQGYSDFECIHCDYLFESRIASAKCPICGQRTTEIK